tara:strand:- start:60 stop:338 length:279 start_codon:yes stop_codon:yes gene_type:complete
MKKFMEKYAEQVGGAAKFVPIIYWLFVWMDFSKLDFLFIFLLPLTVFFWIWVIFEEFQIRKKHPEQKSFFLLILPILFTLVSTVSTIHIYYK